MSERVIIALLIVAVILSAVGMFLSVMALGAA